MSDNNVETTETVNEEAPKGKRGRKTSTPKEETPKRTPHLAKVEKYLSTLPELSEASSEVFDIARNLSTADINVLIAHLNGVTRSRGVEASNASQPLVEGQIVRVISSAHPKYLGLQGRVSKVQRIRCYVEFDGFDKPGYFFHSDVEPAEETLISLEETATELPADFSSDVVATGTDG